MNGEMNAGVLWLCLDESPLIPPPIPWSDNVDLGLLDLELRDDHEHILETITDMRASGEYPKQSGNRRLSSETRKRLRRVRQNLSVRAKLWQRSMALRAHERRETRNSFSA